MGKVGNHLKGQSFQAKGHFFLAKGHYSIRTYSICAVPDVERGPGPLMMMVVSEPQPGQTF